MKKFLVLGSFILFACIFYQCNPTRKANAFIPVTTYTNNVHTLVMNNCAPCHMPDKGGKKKALDSYTAVKDNLPDIIKRIEMHPGEKGFMPFKRDRLSDSSIAVFKDWQADGMAE
ncbi:MAG: cytochrome c [Chitinophagaceae bacterium]|jgi:hypothetical protein|nr:cytochrome c [Chitinophagaceae bacterium]